MQISFSLLLVGFALGLSSSLNNDGEIATTLMVKSFESSFDSKHFIFLVDPFTMSKSKRFVHASQFANLLKKAENDMTHKVGATDPDAISFLKFLDGFALRKTYD